MGEAALNRDLTKVRYILAQHNLKLVTDKSGHVLVQGSEIDKRLSMVEFFFHSAAADIWPEADILGEGLNKQETEGIRKIPALQLHRA